MQKITPFLWFNSEAEEAANFYVSIFKNSKILKTVRNNGAPGPQGGVLTVSFELDGQNFTALNGGPIFKFNEAVSFVVSCESQEETDHLWEKLSAGGSEGRCAWLKDKFGVSWQVVPTALVKLLGDPDAAKAQRVMKAMLQMTKIDISKLEEAAGK